MRCRVPCQESNAKILITLPSRVIKTSEFKQNAVMMEAQNYFYLQAVENRAFVYLHRGLSVIFFLSGVEVF
jgi:hypothetical protein